MSFEDLLKRISSTLRRITYKLNGHFTSFDDEDLFQEALIHLWEDFGEGKLQDKTDSYILQGCYFHLKNYIRKSRIKTQVISLDDIIREEEACQERESALEDEGAGRFLDYLNSKLLAETIGNNGLTQREKEVLPLCAEGLTTREIGQRMGISHVRVVRLIRRIREKCSKYYIDTAEGRF